MARVTYNDITICRTMYDGWRCSALVNGYYTHQDYFYYTKREALKLFHAYVNEKGC